METYSFMREFADSWGLLAMFLFFIGMVLFVFRPGGSREQADSANVIFRNEQKPAGGSSAPNLEEAAQ